MPAVVCVYVNACSCVCICTRMQLYICWVRHIKAYSWVRTCKSIRLGVGVVYLLYIYICICVCVCVCTYAYSWVCVYCYIRTLIYIYILCVCVLNVRIPVWYLLHYKCIEYIGLPSLPSLLVFVCVCFFHCNELQVCNLDILDIYTKTRQ